MITPICYDTLLRRRSAALPCIIFSTRGKEVRQLAACLAFPTIKIISASYLLSVFIFKHGEEFVINCHVGDTYFNYVRRAPFACEWRFIGRSQWPSHHQCDI